METLGGDSWFCQFLFHYDLGDFEELWDLRPASRGTIKMYGKEFEVPRWQKSYGKNYTFPGLVHHEPHNIPKPFLDFLAFCKKRISGRLNGILVNWYNKEDYIALHSDNEKKLLKKEPVVTLTILEDPNEKRKFILKSIDKDGISKEIYLGHNNVLVMGGTCQETHKHGLPRSKKYNSRRISITVRSFSD